ncbi:MAG: hypothetical protein GKR89_22850 [Candidatus Latescibacteria bacterium]|nr:hypothetical protein [Candidatus Latescibacterota bacterium]
MSPSTADVSRKLHRSLQGCRDWQELQQQLALIDRTFAQGTLNATQVEKLTRLSIEVSRTVPERASIATADRPQFEPFGGDRHCTWCGDSHWWAKAGQLVCATCHPQPQTHSLAHSAAA